jgi:hypothetical protein
MIGPEEYDGIAHTRAEKSQRELVDEHSEDEYSKTRCEHEQGEAVAEATGKSDAALWFDQAAECEDIESGDCGEHCE